MEEYLKIALPIAISLIAAIFSILTYKRNRRLENENYIYKTKYESYARILVEINKLVNKLQDYIFEFRNYLSQRNQPGLSDDKVDELDDDIDKLADKVDDLFYDFDDSIISHSLIIPGKVLKQLELFSEKLLDSELPESFDENHDILLQKLDKHISELIQDGNKINVLLRSDLNIEELNMSLYRRIKN